MKTYINPPIQDWEKLSKRQVISSKDLNETVQTIFDEVQNKLSC